MKVSEINRKEIWPALIAAGGAVVGGLIASSGAEDAADASSAAAMYAADLQNQQYQQSRQDLHRVKGISTRMAGRYGRGLLAAIRQGEDQPLAWSDRVRPSNGSNRRQNGKPTAACQARFEALRTWRNAAAEKRGVEPDIVLTNSTLWAVACRNPASRDELSGDDLLAPWQIHEFGDALLAVIRRTR